MLIKVTKEIIKEQKQLDKFKLCHIDTENLSLHNNEICYVYKKGNQIVGYLILEEVNNTKEVIKEKPFEEFLQPLNNQPLLFLKQVAFDFESSNAFTALDFLQSVLKEYSEHGYFTIVRITKENEKFLPYLTKYYQKHKIVSNYWEHKNISCDKCSGKCLCKSVILIKEPKDNPVGLNINTVSNMFLSFLKK